MIGQRRVAIFAGEVKAAALHLDCNDVSRPVIVCAASRGQCRALLENRGPFGIKETPEDLSDGQQFLVEPADLVHAIDKVDFQDPVPLSA